MKNLLLSFVLLFSASVFARDVSTRLTIVKGPFYVPVKNSQFDVLGPDFNSEGEAVLFLTPKTIDFQFPRTDLISLKAVQDKNAPDYYYVPGDKGPKARVGFDGDKLTWFFTSSDMWSVRIAHDAKENGVEAVSFARMSDEQILEFAERVILLTDAGGLGENAKVIRNANSITVEGDVMQMGENDDDPSDAGTVTFTFVDKKDGTRTIDMKASVTDRE